MNFRKLFTFNNKNYRRFKNYDDEYRSSIDEIVIHSNQHDCQPSTSVTRVSNIPESVDNLTTCLQVSNIKTLLNNTNKVLVLKFHTSSRPTSTELNEVSQQCLKKSIVILLTSDDERNFFLYWKSKDLGHFLTFKIYDRFEFMNDVKFFEFLTNFLGCSLNRGHLGLHSGASTNSGPTTIQLHHLADHRNYNLLLVAAEVGNAYIVQLMLTLGFSSEFREVNAQTLAWKNRHFEVLLLLLKSSLIYPYTIYIDECPNDIQEFYEISRRLNEAIMLRDEVTVLRILTQNPQIIHFYNLNNESAPAFALKRRLFDMYKLLISKNILLGPHEKFSDIIEDMKEADREKLREIHYVGSQNLPDNHMHVLMSNSRLGHDTSDSTKKYEIIQKAFETMNQNRFVQIILMIVAASRNFRIIFDFNRDSVEVVDPTADESTDGLFYSENGRIYIGAKKLLDERTRLDALGVMAHEFCHYVMCLVYKNCGNPYGCGDKQGEQEFKEISRMCLKNAGNERVVDVVHECYPACIHHAELVVRVPHLIMKYFNNPERFGVIKVIYESLFDAFEGRIYKDLQDALPKIEANAETEKEKSKRKIRKLRNISLLVGLLAVVGIVGGILVSRQIFYKPTYKFSNLSQEDQIKVENAPVLYKNVSIKFLDLFPINSTAYDLLTSDDISLMLHGIPLDFSDPHVFYLDKLVSFTWVNLTEKLKNKFIDSNFSFQNESVKYEIFNESYSAVYDSLTSQQIIKVLNGVVMNVHKMIKNETQFYAERKVFDEYIYEVYFMFMFFLNAKQPDWVCQYQNKTGTFNDTFEKFYNNFMLDDFETRINHTDLLVYDQMFRRCSFTDFKLRNPKTGQIVDYLFLHKSVQIGWDEIIQKKFGIFLLSSDAGTGKTETFKQFSLRFKREYPSMWVSYIDFRDCKQFLNTSVVNIAKVRDILIEILGVDLHNKFEMEIFTEYFNSGNLVLFWDGFDQISPDYRNVVQNITKLIYENTLNVQFISTRPSESNFLRSTFKTEPYTFVPLVGDTQIAFLEGFFLSLDMSKTDIPIYIEKALKIVNSTGSRDEFSTPLLLGMIADIIANDAKIFKSENLYEIFGKFIEKKYKYWVKQNDVLEFISDLVASGLSVPKLHQKFALRIYREPFVKLHYTFLSLKLKIMRKKILSDRNANLLSRMGIASINSHKYAVFACSTFGDFFIAQYLIENIYDADDEPSINEANMRIQILFLLTKSPGVLRFISSYLETMVNNNTNSFDSQISNALKSKYKNILIFSLEHPMSVPLLINFFSKDHNLLTEMLKIETNDGLYPSSYNYVNLAIFTYRSLNRSEIGEVAKSHLTIDEFEKFKSCKDQKGIILLSMFKVKQLRNSSEEARRIYSDYNLPNEILDNKNNSNVLEIIVSNLTINETRKLLTSKIVWYPQIQLRSLFNHSYSTKVPQKQLSDEPVWIDIGQYEFEFLKTLWNLIEQHLLPNEQKNVVSNNLALVFQFTNETTKDNFMITVDNLFTNLEIYEIFLNNNILHYTEALGNVHYYFARFEYSWNFIVNRTTWEQQKELLKKSVEIECYLNEFFYKFCYLVPKINLLQNSLITELGFYNYNSTKDFTKMLSIYEFYFNATELQDIILSGSKDFIPFLIILKQNYICEMYAKFLKKIFINNSAVLRKFLLTNIERTKLNIFGLLDGCDVDDRNIKIFKDLLN